MINSIIQPKGYVEILVTNVLTSEIVKHEVKNTVLTIGKSALARSLAAYTVSPFEFYIDSMIFGNGGEDNNIPRVVDVGRSTLFNDIGLSVTVARGWTSSYSTRASFTGTIDQSTAVGETINEAGLKLANSELFSMVTFAGLSKTAQLQFTLNWNIVFA